MKKTSVIKVLGVFVVCNLVYIIRRSDNCSCENNQQKTVLIDVFNCGCFLRTIKNKTTVLVVFIMFIIFGLII